MKTKEGNCLKDKVESFPINSFSANLVESAAPIRNKPKGKGKRK